MSMQLTRSPWHAGELAIQRHAGVAERMDDVGRRVVRDYMPEQHREFFSQLPFMVIGAVDDAGGAWATLRAGLPGFAESPDPHTLQLHIEPDAADPADAGMHEGHSLGLLGIDLLTRRRNRMNGTITGQEADSLDIAVGQSFGNCPQYIQKRVVEYTRDPRTPSGVPAIALHSLDERARTMISRADTFFVASYADEEDGKRKVDVSHRGGQPGFVRLDADGGLTIPDFAGNLFFNTLGNILSNNKAGLVFADFATGDLLQLSGDAQVILDSPEIAAFQGAERLWRFMPRHVVYRPAALPLHWIDKADGASPNSLMTGNWSEAARRLKGAALAKAWRKLRVTKIVDESSLVRSFHLEPIDDAGLVPHAAGQHLPIRISLGEGEPPAIRNYTLSTAASDRLYRISVKREGKVSRHLHDTLKVGDVIEARAPAGGFTIDALEQRPAVLLAAGIGITPMLAMLRHVVYEGWRKRAIRPTWLFYSARSATQRAFAGELRELADNAQGAIQLVRTLTDTHNAVKGVDYEATGRIDMDLLRARLPLDDYDFYICGPAAFMQAMYDGLCSLNIADERIHAESFGPAALRRTQNGKADNEVVRAPAQHAMPITFVKSAKAATWKPGGGTLLELAEQSGLSPEFECRSGSCGTCRTKILRGTVSYASAPSFDVPDDEALICCAVPAAAQGTGEDRLELDL
jgi:ferredoxin-NADP reductase/predicted pyridoxine 5'-phosphate oxidase superfamily flavin-nucleotide-binding protein